MTRKLSSIEVNVLHKLEKHGELTLKENGNFGKFNGFGDIPKSRMERLAAEGYCRIDRVGESTFAVFLTRTPGGTDV